MATALGLFIIPVCYIFVQRIVDRRKTPASATPATPDTPAPDDKGGH
jgi:hypothetical protein